MRKRLSALPTYLLPAVLATFDVKQLLEVPPITYRQAKSLDVRYYRNTFIDDWFVLKRSDLDGEAMLVD